MRILSRHHAIDSSSSIQHSQDAVRSTRIIVAACPQLQIRSLLAFKALHCLYTFVADDIARIITRVDRRGGQRLADGSLEEDPEEYEDPEELSSVQEYGVKTYYNKYINDGSHYKGTFPYSQQYGQPSLDQLRTELAKRFSQFPKLCFVQLSTATFTMTPLYTEVYNFWVDHGMGKYAADLADLNIRTGSSCLQRLPFRGDIRCIEKACLASIPPSVQSLALPVNWGRATREDVSLLEVINLRHNLSSQLKSLCLKVDCRNSNGYDDPDHPAQKWISLASTFVSLTHLALENFYGGVHLPHNQTWLPR